MLVTPFYRGGHRGSEAGCMGCQGCRQDYLWPRADHAMRRTVGKARAGPGLWKGSPHAVRTHDGSGMLRADFH